MPSSSAQRFHTIAVVIALAAVAGILIFLVLRPRVVAQTAPGVVQPTEIKIGPEISGRLLRFAVAPGQSVQKGDLLAELSNPELEAALVLAQAQRAIAFMPARARSKSRRSRAASTWRTQT